MTYIFNGETHSDYSQEHMKEIGMNDDAQLSVLGMRELQHVKNQDAARFTRDAAIGSDLEYKGNMFQVDSAGIASIASILINAGIRDSRESETRSWRLSNNTFTEVTLLDLRTIHTMHGDRLDDIWSQFRAWDDAGDYSVNFEVN